MTVRYSYFFFTGHTIRRFFLITKVTYENRAIIKKTYVSAFKKAVQVHPRDTYARLNLAEEYRRRGQLADSRTELDEVLRIDPSNEIAKSSLARIKNKK